MENKEEKMSNINVDSSINNNIINKSTNDLNRSSNPLDLQNNFLNLLIAQIKNQDPTDPIKNTELTSQLAQINWSRDNLLWKDNLIRIDPKPKNPNKPFKLSTSANAVTDAVKMVKEKLEWVSGY